MKKTTKAELMAVLNSGREMPFWIENELCMGETWKCESCDNHGYVNAMKVVSGATNEMFFLADSLRENGLVLSELNADEEGGTICYECFKKQERQV